MKDFFDFNDNGKFDSYDLLLVLATIMVLFGIVLCILGFYALPIGQIDPSVLAAFGEILTFSGAIFGIRTKYQSELDKYKIDKNKEKY